MRLSPFWKGRRSSSGLNDGEGGRLIFMLGKSSGGQRWHPLEYFGTLLEDQYWPGLKSVLAFKEGSAYFHVG